MLEVALLLVLLGDLRLLRRVARVGVGVQGRERGGQHRERRRRKKNGRKKDAGNAPHVKTNVKTNVCLLARSVAQKKKKLRNSRKRDLTSSGERMFRYLDHSHFLSSGASVISLSVESLSHYSLRDSRLRLERQGGKLASESEVESPKYSLDEVKAITHPGFGGPGRERYSLAI